MPFQELRDALGILAMPLHAQRQRLQTLQEQPGIERGCSGTDVSQQLYASLDNICQGSQCLDIAQTMIRGIGLNKPREASVGPIELAAIDDDTANGCAMPPDELGCRMYDNI